MLAEPTEANSSREQKKTKTSEKGFSHLEAKLADKTLDQVQSLMLQQAINRQNKRCKVSSSVLHS